MLSLEMSEHMVTARKTAPWPQATSQQAESDSGHAQRFLSRDEAGIAATLRKFRRAMESGEGRFNTEDANTTYNIVDLQLDRAGLIAFHKLLRAFVISARELRVRGRKGLETVSMAILVAPER
jgi:hypothetical protein